MNENLEYLRNQLSQARNEIKNLRQQLSSLKYEHHKEVEYIKSALFNWKCSACSEEGTRESNHVNVQLNAEAAPSETSRITYDPIGYIETSFQNKRAVPRQPSVLSSSQGVVCIENSIFNNPEHAFNGLEEFSHMWIIFHFHATVGTGYPPAKVSPPRLRGERLGVFATRAPRRPCPIGLSLVRIVKIEGNKIHFTGVDMVNRTPVLDVKPYIPQYDHPGALYNNGTTNAMAGLTRPPTEGTSDISSFSTVAAVVDGTDNLSLNGGDNGRGAGEGTLPEAVCAIIVDTPAMDVVDSVEARREMLQPALSPSLDSPSSIDLLDDSDSVFLPTSPSRSTAVPATERGAPDGQERFTPPQAAQLNPCDPNIRVAPWVNNPPAVRMEVSFTEDALARLHHLIGERATAFKTNLQSLLAEDPRSNYVRTRYPDHEYSCVLEDLSIGCVFNDNAATCTVVSVNSADDMQNT